MIYNYVIAYMWNGPQVVTRLREAPPPPEYMAAWLDELADRFTAANAGVRPAVKVVQGAELVGFEVPDVLPEEVESEPYAERFRSLPDWAGR
jgi:hypothetical protein